MTPNFISTWNQRGKWVVLHRLLFDGPGVIKMSFLPHKVACGEPWWQLILLLVMTVTKYHLLQAPSPFGMEISFPLVCYKKNYPLYLSYNFSLLGNYRKVGHVMSWLTILRLCTGYWEGHITKTWVKLFILSVCVS